MPSQSSVSKSVKKTSSSEKKAKTKVKLDEFDVTKVKFEEIDMKMKGQKQGIGYVSYVYPHGKNNFVLQVDAINMTQYPIPKKEWVEGKRTNFTIPFDPEQENCNRLKEVVHQLDDKLQDKTVKDDIFGNDPKLVKKMKYSPIIKVPKETDDDEDGVKVKFDKMKINLDINYNTGEINTKVYTKENNDAKAIARDVKTIEDLEKYFTYGSQIRLILMVNKLWAAKTDIGGYGRLYGAGFKVLQMEIIPRENTSVKQEFKSNQFDSDSEDEEVQLNEASDDEVEEVKPKTTPKAKTSKVVVDDEVDDEVEEAEEDKDETEPVEVEEKDEIEPVEEVIEPVEEVEEKDEESEEEKKPKKSKKKTSKTSKKSKKKTPPPASDSDSDSDTESESDSD
jgi:hypothetical protein